MVYDILADSALEIATGLIREAWGGEMPAGGLDFPSACVLSRSTMDDSDLHVELGYVEEPDNASDIPWLADITHTDQRAPADTDSPFRFPAGEASAPGMFGKALRAYGEVMAICTEYGVDTAAYDGWFRAQWGVDPGADLSTAIPVVRSHGDALWGGMHRKLSPGVYAHAAASKQIRVVWHGTQRGKFGAHKLVDWPRLTAIAQNIGAALLVEDRYSKLTRIDFKVVRKELPDAPQSIGKNFERLFVPKAWPVRNVTLGAIEHLQGFKKSALLLARHAIGSQGSVEFDPSIQIPSSSLVKFLTIPHPMHVPRMSLLTMGEPIFDLIDQRTNPVPVPDRDKKADVFKAFASAVHPFVELYKQDVPMHYQINADAYAMSEDSAGEANAAKKRVRDLIRKVVPDDFLLRIFRIFSIIYRSKEKGGDVVISLLKAMDAPKSVFETHDFVAVGVRVKNAAKCYKWMALEIAKTVSRTRMMYGEELRLSTNIRRILSSSATGDIALAEIVRKRKNWWANEYRRRAKFSQDSPRKISYQIRSKLFRHMRLKVSDSDGVSVDRKDQGLGSALHSVAASFVRKRKGKGKRDPTVVEHLGGDVRDYAKKLDTLYKPKVTFVSAWDEFIESAGYLVKDVEKVLAFIAEDAPRAAEEPEGDVDSEVGEIDYLTEESDSVADEDKELIKDEDAKNHIEDFAEEGEDDKSGGGWMLDEESDEEQVADDRVDLALELADEYPHFTHEMLAQAVSEHSEFVPSHMVRIIGDEMHRNHVADLVKKGYKRGVEIAGGDIADRRM